ncbi:MAG TPA: AAA family ATPase [Candidatus Paceibacterota bacterium]
MTNNLYPITLEGELLPDEEPSINNTKKHLEIIPGDYFLTAPIKEKPFLVAGMIPEGSLSILTADSGSGKSLLMLILSKHIALGEKLFNTFEVKQSNILIVDTEQDSDILASRHKAFIDCSAPIYYIHNQSFDICDDEDFFWLADEMLSKNIGLIILDTISGVHSLEENSAKEMKELTKKLLDLVRLTRSTLIFLHHHRKKMAGENYSQGSARGSTALMAAVASHLLLTSKKEVDEFGNSVLKMTIEQFKSRRPDGINKIGLNIIYNPETKKSAYEYLGEIDEKSQSLSSAKEFLNSFMQLGTEYTIEELFSEKKNQGLVFGKNIIRSACKELIDENILDSHKGTGKEWNKSYYFKTF